ncbi:MAG: hypothetical protein E6Q97_28515 [Desulfurellales bacterium]|nr:MAG: hypothetical protein E6Q97_28515 [Desulfurellales bacterium]
MGHEIEIRPHTVGDGLCIEQMHLVAEILNLLKGHGVTTVQLRHINAVIEAANRICDEFGRADQVAAPGSGLVAWACSDSVGMSSVYMARRLAPVAGLRFPGHRIPDEPAHPYDPSDFGRCLGLLDAVPEIRPYIAKMAEYGKVWAAYVEHWDELETLYKEESTGEQAPKLYARMQELQRE